MYESRNTQLQRARLSRESGVSAECCGGCYIVFSTRIVALRWPQLIDRLTFCTTTAESDHCSNTATTATHSNIMTQWCSPKRQTEQWISSLRTSPGSRSSSRRHHRVASPPLTARLLALASPRRPFSARSMNSNSLDDSSADVLSPERAAASYNHQQHVHRPPFRLSNNAHDIPQYVDKHLSLNSPLRRTLAAVHHTRNSGENLSPLQQQQHNELLKSQLSAQRQRNSTINSSRSPSRIRQQQRVLSSNQQRNVTSRPASPLTPTSRTQQQQQSTKHLLRPQTATTQQRNASQSNLKLRNRAEQAETAVEALMTELQQSQALISHLEQQLQQQQQHCDALADEEAQLNSVLTERDHEHSQLSSEAQLQSQFQTALIQGLNSFLTGCASFSSQHLAVVQQIAASVQQSDAGPPESPSAAAQLYSQLTQSIVEQHNMTSSFASHIATQADEVRQHAAQ